MCIILFSGTSCTHFTRSRKKRKTKGKAGQPGEGTWGWKKKRSGELTGKDESAKVRPHGLDFSGDRIKLVG